MLTTRGWSLAIVAAVLVAAGVAVGIEELYVLAAAAVALLGASAAWVHARSWELDTLRSLHPSRVAAGEDARVELVVRNRSVRRSPLVAAEDPFDGGARRATFLIAPLEPGAAEHAVYRLPTSRRGVFKLGPLRLVLSDPFGLVSLTRPGALPSTLTVHPRIERLAPPRLSTGTDQRSSARAGVVGAHGEEFYALRDYRVGDDLRRVHWAATARVDDLMIRQDETHDRGRLTVAVDLRESSWDPESLEAALSGAASIATAALVAFVEVRLVHTGGVDTGFVGPAGRAAVLDALAMASTHHDPEERLPASLERLGALDGAAVVVTSDAVSREDLVRLAGRDGRRLVSVVVVERPRGGASPDKPAAGAAQVITVPAGAPLAPVWDRALGARTAVRGA